MIGMNHSTHKKIINMKNDKKRKSSNKEIEINLDPSEFDLELAMLISYESIMLLGTCIFNDKQKFKDDLLGAYHSCMEHFLEKKDYEKVNEISNILNMMDDPRPVTIDSQVIDSINIFLN
jgi:hypothetical protein